MADLTGLTGMLATPAKGMGHKGVGDNAAQAGEGGESAVLNHPLARRKHDNQRQPLEIPAASIPQSLAALQARLEQLQTETSTSRRRIRELELELERHRVESAKSRRAQDERVRELERERDEWSGERRRLTTEQEELRRRVRQVQSESDEWRQRYEKAASDKDGKSVLRPSERIRRTCGLIIA
jgi:chromosome segregation ATPase